jgi:phospholipid/cholesterol/gamma-HCH transport system substrate-binding protein
MSRNFRLGMFVTMTLAAAGVAVFWVGGQQFRFSRTYRLSAEFQNVEGLADGAEVRVGGLREGTVTHIDLPKHPGEKMRVTMNLKSATQNVIKKDSTASVRSEGLVGDEFVEITFGSEQAEPVKNGDTINGQATAQMSDLLQKADKILDSTEGTVQNVQATADNLKSITGKINSGSGSLGSLLNSKSVYQNVNAATSDMQDDMEALKHNFLLRGFFKKRGYEDQADLKKYEVSNLPDKQAAKTFVFEGSKIFRKPDSAQLKDQKALDEVGKYLQDNPFGLAVVVGYTGKGDTDKDKVLTEAQTLAVREYLTQHYKLDDTRLKTMGRGKSPDLQEGTRIEIVVYPG